jgi:hypothetical protein
MAKQKRIDSEVARALRKQAKALTEEHAAVALRLADTLYSIFYCTVRAGDKEINLVQAWGFKSFHDYAEEELGMHGSTGFRYVKIWDRLIVECELKPAELPASITKLVQLSRLPKRDVRGWLKRAGELSCCALENAVSEHLEGRGAKHHVSIQMSWSDAKRLYAKLRRAKEVFGEETYGRALTKAMEQWAELEAKTHKLRKVG